MSAARTLVLLGLTGSLVACTAPVKEPYLGLPLWAQRLESRSLSDPLEPTSRPRRAPGPERPLGSPVDLSAKAGRGDAGPKPQPPRRGGGGPGRGPARASAPRPAPPPQPASAPRPPERSRLERLYQGDYAREASRTLDQFGYSCLRQASADAPLGPVPDDYRIGPGDELVIRTEGSFNELARLTVGRDGRIHSKELGVLPVARRPFGELQPLIHAAYAKRHRQFTTTVSMGRLRRIEVHVTGLVARAGAVQVPALATVVEALGAAGGALESGSLRRVQLQRQGVEQRVDLYGYLVGGAPAPRLQAGDVLRVVPIGSTVGVAGFVRRPGIYELLGPLTLAGAFELAGGLTPFAFTPKVVLERTDRGRRVSLDLDLTKSARRLLSDGELIQIGAVESKRQPLVRVGGEVVRPGNYPFSVGLRVSDLIRRADGLTVEAFLPQAFVSRQLPSSAAASAMPSAAPETGRQLLVIDLRKALAHDPAHDVVLAPLDLLRVRSRREAVVLPTVELRGAVQQPGSYELCEGLRISDLVALGGNALPDAFLEEGTLIRRRIEAKRASLDAVRVPIDLRAALRGEPEHDLLLEAGDRLVLRRLRRDEVRVELTGEVRFPGTYVFPARARISDLLAAGKLLYSSDLRAASFTRRSVRELQLKRFRHLLERTRRLHEGALVDLTNTGHSREAMAGKLSLEHTKGLMDRIRRSELTGRIVVPFLREDFLHSGYDLYLEDGDRLHVPRQLQTVSVVGLVFNPSTFVADPGLTVEQVLERAGGLAEEADDERIYVVLANGESRQLDEGSHPLTLDTVLEAGDVVLVPRRPLERALGNELADAVAMARQMSEIALILSKVANPASGVNLSSTNTNSGALPESALFNNR